MPWRLLLRRFDVRGRIARRTRPVTVAAEAAATLAVAIAPIAATATAVAIAEAAATAAVAAEAEAAFVALAVAIHLAHHRRRPLFELVDAHGEIAQNVF